MADSIQVPITGLPAIMQTYIIDFDMQPRTGKIPFDVAFSGFLTYQEGTLPIDPLFNGETIIIQILDPTDGQWKPTGVTAVTKALLQGNTLIGYGYFEGSINFPGPAGGPWQLRAHYDGNASKNLEGCD